MESVVRGYHAYMDIWSPSGGNELPLEVDEPNIHDRYTVATKVDGPGVTRKLRFYTLIPRASSGTTTDLNLRKTLH